MSFLFGRCANWVRGAGGYVGGTCSAGNTTTPPAGRRPAGQGRFLSGRAGAVASRIMPAAWLGVTYPRPAGALLGQARVQLDIRELLVEAHEGGV
ncbi:hypothetical protein, partial [Actinotignum timonense]|uniref:hypothetical protein n=1 Tax=Actinotignum timonense TaxID=1870995 RepID=UPI00254D0760